MTTKIPLLRRGATAWLSIMLFILALLPRLPVGSFLTIDEAYHWFSRVKSFVTALSEGDFAATNLIGHPGVTTLWLGSAARLIHNYFVDIGMIDGHDQDLYRVALRLPIALVTSLAIALAYPLLRRLFGGRAALLAALFWAGEPFVVAHSQLLHLDALLTSFMMLSLLLMLAAIESSSAGLARSRWWIASGAVGGLALLTKSPAVFLTPFAGLFALIGIARISAASTPPERDVRWLLQLVVRSIAPTLVWLAAAALVWAALWPAAWVDPLDAAGRMILQASADGGSPHGWGNFFLGQAIADPGPLFYLVTIPFRLTPWTLIGAAFWAGFALRDWRRAWNGSNRALLLMALYAVLFIAVLTVLPKKFDRYALPAFPALTVLAAVGWLRALDVVRPVLQRGRPAADRETAAIGKRAPSWLVPFAGYGLVIALLAGNLIDYRPYYLAYFNPLLGGGERAQHLVPVGWGEGYELATAFIAEQPNGADRPIAVRYEPVAEPFAPAHTVPLAEWQKPRHVDYVILYIDQMQREEKPETYLPLLTRTPVYTVRIHGIDYAYVYQIPPPTPMPIAADFGDAIHLRGYDLNTTAIRASGYLTVTLEWESRTAVDKDYSLFVHVLNAEGTRVAQVDVPVGGDRWPTSRWPAGRYVTLVQRVPVPANLTPDDYRLAIGIYDPASFARLPVSVAPGLLTGDDGGGSMTLAWFRLR